MSGARLFDASGGTGFADLIIDGHRKTWPLRGKRLRLMVMHSPPSLPAPALLP